MRPARLAFVTASVVLAVPAAAGAYPVPAAPKCPIFPRTNVWNKRVDTLPVAANSDAIIASIGADTGLHADFGSGLWEGAPIGIPITVVSGTQRKSRVRFEYTAESDRGPYPIPKRVAIEGGRRSDGDRHAIVVDRDNCVLYELFALYPRAGSPPWRAGSGAIWSLRSNRLRPAGWTSADAAGLPILPGLARYSDVRRVRLKASFEVSRFPRQARIVLQALKRYGMIVADNGSNWFISGAPNRYWSNDQLRTLRQVKGSDFEVVDTSSLRNG